MVEWAPIITAIATAVGTHGLTYLVMNKMQKIQISKIKEFHDLQINHMAENCKNCKANLDEKINDIEQGLEKVEGRQSELREKDLPNEYVKHRELTVIEKKLKDEVEIAHKRIDKYHPARAVGGT